MRPEILPPNLLTQAALCKLCEDRYGALISVSTAKSTANQRSRDRDAQLALNRAQTLHKRTSHIATTCAATPPRTCLLCSAARPPASMAMALYAEPRTAPAKAPFVYAHNRTPTAHPLSSGAYVLRKSPPTCTLSLASATTGPVISLSIPSPTLRFIPRSRHTCSGSWDGCKSVTTKSMSALVAALILRRHEGGRTSSTGAFIARRDIRGFLSSASPLATDASLD
jgi:hypothetical protein